MTLLYYKILFFSLIPLGLFLLVLGIRSLWMASQGKILLSLPFNDGSGEFKLTKSGFYSVLHKGPILKKTPVADFRPQIVNLDTNDIITLNASIMSPRSSGFSTARTELFTFNAPAGEYELSLIEGSSVSTFQTAIGRIIPLANIDLEQYVIEVRESQSQLLTMLSIPLLLLGMAGMVCGLVFGLLADKLFI